MLRGDTSGTVIHPFFIHAAQSLGMYFCQGMENSSAMIRLQEKYLHMSFEWLTEVFKGYDWELRAQVAVWVTSASITLSEETFGLRYMRKSFDAVAAAGLRFAPSCGRPPEFSEALHEKLSVLSQIIYFENYWFLTCGGAEPTKSAGIEEEFRHQLPVRPNILYIASVTVSARFDRKSTRCYSESVR